jgi:hypothetical protein
VRVLEQILLLVNAWTLSIPALLKYYNIAGLHNYKELPWTRIGMASVKSLYSHPFKMVVGQCMISMLPLSMALVETSTRLGHVIEVLRVMKRSSGCPIYCRMIFQELGSSHLGILHNGLQAKEFARSLLQALRQLSDKVACTNLLLKLELIFKGNIYPHIIFVGHSLGGIVVK